MIENIIYQSKSLNNLQILYKGKVQQERHPDSGRLSCYELGQK
jgi:hypothetical protein